MKIQNCLTKNGGPVARKVFENVYIFLKLQNMSVIFTLCLPDYLQDPSPLWYQLILWQINGSQTVTVQLHYIKRLSIVIKYIK